MEVLGGGLAVNAPIKNIDDPAYENLYHGIDSNVLIRWFHRWKFQCIIPLLGKVRRDAKIIDVGCATGGLLVFLQSRGYSDLTGLDLVDRRHSSLKTSVSFIESSICDPGMHISETFDVVLVLSMLHHLDVTTLHETAANLVKLMKPHGQLFIYEPNVTSWVGKIFYRYFLRIFPALFRANMLEWQQQQLFCQAWPDFVRRLEAKGLQVQKRSEMWFYKALVLNK